MNFIGIIPARYASTRFPGKPLVMINGKMMIQRVFEQASKVFDHVVVATDDKRIFEAVEGFGGKVVMTSKKHRSGTDRCAEAVSIYESDYDIEFDVVVNIQGDEPFIYPEQLKEVAACFKNKKVQIATLAKPINNSEDIFNPNKPKVIVNKKQDAIYFSRSPIPYVRDEKQEKWVKYRFYKHIGLYAYRKDVLHKITRLDATPLEIAESLEQLRWIENGYKIKVEFTEYESISIDTKADLKKVDTIGLM